MPVYEFRNRESGEVEEHRMSYTQIDDFLEMNTHLERYYSAPNVSSNTKDNISRASDGWNDLLKGIKKSSDGQNTIKTK